MNDLFIVYPNKEKCRITFSNEHDVYIEKTVDAVRLINSSVEQRKNKVQEVIYLGVPKNKFRDYVVKNKCYVCDRFNIASSGIEFEDGERIYFI